jgi:aldehyde:ferredoxin oxidoreductase
MAEPCGYAGFILEVDLERREFRRVPLDEALLGEYMGGKGFGAHFIFNNIKGMCDPLSPENPLIFATGPLTGSLAPSSSRMVVCTISPETGIWLDSNCGGFLGPELKMAGFDAVVIRGRADSPVLLVLEDGQARLEDASQMWGMDTFSAHRWIKKRLGPEYRVATIGPAGENGVLFASIISEYRAFGRGGAGAVMGSKNLKALAVHGTGSIKVADPRRFIRACKEAFNELAIHPETGGGRQAYGTNVILSCMLEAGIHPVRNFQKGLFSGSDEVNEEVIKGFYIRHRSCFGCPIHCSKIARVPEGPFSGTVVEGPEYENVWSFGAQCENTDVSAIIHAEYLCDYYGMDGISTGNVVGFLMECMERGLIREKDVGFPLRFGDAHSMIRAVHAIGRREGPGEYWGEGVRRLSQRIPGSEDAAMHVKGLEIPAYDPRGSTGMALAYATSDRGGCHLRAWTIGKELLSTDDRMDLFSTEFKAEFVKTQQDLFTVLNATGLCLFAISAIGMRQITELLHSLTALDAFSSSEEILKSGERINNVVRIVNLRQGITAKDDTLPRRFFERPLEEGPCRGRVVDLKPLLEEYYLVRGWDERGVPREEKLQELGIRWR